MDLERLFTVVGLTAEEYTAFGDQFRMRQLRAGDTLFHQGDPAGAFYLVGAGELSVTAQDPVTGAAPRVIAIREEGSCFGEIGLLSNAPRTASITALTDVVLYELDALHFHTLRADNQDFARFLDDLKVMRLLSLVPLFKDLDEESLRFLRGEMRVWHGREGEAVASTGQPVNRLFLLLDGQIRRLKNGDQTGLLETGAHHGTHGLLAEQTWEEDLVLTCDSTFFILDKDHFEHLVRHHPQVAFSIPQAPLVRTLPAFLSSWRAYVSLPALGINRPKSVLWASTLVTLVLVLFAVMPSVWPIPYLNGLHVDTDPENMLAVSDPTRRYHRLMKQRMDLSDILVLGIVNESHPQGVFNAKTLRRVHKLTKLAESLSWPDVKNPQRLEGVIAPDIIAPSTVDVVEHSGPGAVRFSWVMPEPPADDEGALAVFRTLQRYPMMDGTLLSDDGRALSLYLPLTSKDVSYRVYSALQEEIGRLDGDDRFFITGLPVAEDAFGVEMFYQMAISAPLAMLVIFLLMFYFFRNLVLVLAPMAVAMIAVLCTMALLVISGNTLHIMSSMIPIFIMPIAVLDAVHILSEFTEFYPRLRNRKLTLEHVMRELFKPMFFTSLTTVIGFASLALVPIPPVRVFGVFVAVGVGLAWLLTISLVPAYVMRMSEANLASLLEAHAKRVNTKRPLLAQLLRRMHALATGHARLVIAVTLGVVMACAWGIVRLQVNDNPVRWFAEGHPIRNADQALNEHFAGTYMAYLALEAVPDSTAVTSWRQELGQRITDWVDKTPEYAQAGADLETELDRLARDPGITPNDFARQLENYISAQMDTATDDVYPFWEDALAMLDELRAEQQPFKDPTVLEYLEHLQAALEDTNVVGKSLSVADIVKTINRDLRSGNAKDYVLPNSRAGIAQSLLTYQGGHRPQDLWRFVTPDFTTASIWLLLNSGDNQDMARVVRHFEDYVAQHPPPVALDMHWFGLTYVNVAWQDKMVHGMMLAIVSGYLTVLIVMVLLLRSLLWGLTAMVPLTAAILSIYGLLGLMGKDYDMPVAVLSALTIGLAVDFTIHFLVRVRHLEEQTGSWQRAMSAMFDEPARAIVRNILVVAIGFLPLLAAPLVPYNTVGTLIATILFVSGVATLVVVPAVLQIASRHFFAGTASANSRII